MWVIMLVIYQSEVFCKMPYIKHLKERKSNKNVHYAQS